MARVPETHGVKRACVSALRLALNSTPQEILNRYERPLLAFARHLQADNEAARDAVQETFLRYFKFLPPGEMEAIAPWLFTVCRRVIIDDQRKNHRMTRMNEGEAQIHAAAIDETSANPSENLLRRDDAILLRQLVRELPDRQRELVRLKFESGLSYRDIAAATGLSVSNVGTLLHHAVRELRERFHALLQA